MYNFSGPMRPRWTSVLISAVITYPLINKVFADIREYVSLEGFIIYFIWGLSLGLFWVIAIGLVNRHDGYDLRNSFYFYPLFITMPWAILWWIILILLAIILR